MKTSIKEDLHYEEQCEYLIDCWERMAVVDIEEIERMAIDAVIDFTDFMGMPMTFVKDVLVAIHNQIVYVNTQSGITGLLETIDAKRNLVAPRADANASVDGNSADGGTDDGGGSEAVPSGFPF